MSGFEVAGIILGSIPLIISALEHYRTGASTLDRWHNYDRKLRGLARNLETERRRLQNICESLLKGIVPNHQIDTMIKEPMGPSWRQESIRPGIRSRLWDYVVMQEIEDRFEDTRKAVDELKKRLNLPSEGASAQAINNMDPKLGIKDNEVFAQKNDRMARLLFTFRRSKYEGLIERINQNINIIERLVLGSLQLEPDRQARSQGRLKLVREVYGSVYRALCSSLQCSCSHELHLGLEARSLKTRISDKDEDIVNQLEFKLALNSGGTSLADSLRGWSELTWDEIIVRPSLPTVANTTTLTPALPQGSRIFKVSTNSSIDLAFRSPATSTTTTTILQSTSSVVVDDILLTQASGSISETSQTSINLCQSIRSDPKTPVVDSYGMIGDHDPRQQGRWFGVCRAPDGSGKQGWETFSLKQYLENSRPPILMSPTAKLHLATMISSSFLQLYKTPWLLDPMTGDHIIFLKKSDDPANMCVQFKDAFVMKRHIEKTKGLQYPKITSFVRNPALVSLGILLSELHHGKTIDSCQEPYKRPHNENEKLYRASLTAQRLLANTNWMNKEYSNAVQICLCGDFDGPERDVMDEGFRQEMYEKVVGPLEESLRRLTLS